MKKNLFLLSLLAISISIAAAAATNSTQKTKSITIYGNSPQTWNYNWYRNYNNNVPGFAVITNSIDSEMNQGENEVFVRDLPEQIDPSSIKLNKLSPDVSIIEQQISLKRSIQGDLLQNSIGQSVEVVTNEGSGAQVYKGTLLEISPRIVIKEDDKVRVINSYSSISAKDSDAKPQNTYSKWLLYSKEGDNLNAEYSFKTTGINWSAEYVLYLTEDKSDDKLKATLEGWANIANSTNFDVEKASLKLVAGDINQENDNVTQPMMMRNAVMAEGAADMAMAPKSFSATQQKMSDLYSFTIERGISLPSNSFKKIRLFDDKRNVFLTRKYIFNGFNGTNKVDVVLNMENTSDKGLGMALAGGKYVVYTKDATGNYDTIGEAVVEGKKEKDLIELNIGSAFDVSAKRYQTNEKYDNNKRFGAYRVTIELENSKTKEVMVSVKEQLNNQNWKILNETKNYLKINENMVMFPVKIAAKSKETLQFDVEYSW